MFNRGTRQGGFRPRRADSTGTGTGSPGTRLGLRRLRPGLIGRAAQRPQEEREAPAEPLTRHSRPVRAETAPRKRGLPLRGAFGGSTHPCRLA